MAEFSFIDLFAGIGGFRLALEALGGKCLGFSEIFKDAITTYCKNYGETEQSNFGDITKIKDLPMHDFMTAGVPCQSWSIAGKNLGFDDDRGQLWNDTLYLLNKVRPKAFIFENVKGLADPRNSKALQYILERIEKAGYYAKPYVLNANDYGVPQTRVRIYIIGFNDERYYRRFLLPKHVANKPALSDVLDGEISKSREIVLGTARKPRWSLSCRANGMNDYFLFNDLRNGDTTIHSWNITETTVRQKQICYLLLRNRRKSIYGPLDGNPLSLKHFQELDPTISKIELEQLVDKNVLKRVKYAYRLNIHSGMDIDDKKSLILRLSRNDIVNVDELKSNRELKLRKIALASELEEMESLGMAICIEQRYDFKNSKISTGLNGINRIFLPSSSIYPTLVASDTNDYVTNVEIEASTIEEFRSKFLSEVYEKRAFRKITKSEACRIQGFPSDFILPESRPRWMHLIGNSVSVPVVRLLAKAVIATGVFSEEETFKTNDRRYVYPQIDNQWGQAY